ncbi:hypothetical protein SDC9_158789 [bioreactor metagenome]|uniref:Uncharacterized protein n=1 Tax=bioreactor metagenome TaxID=1076179 RepID=A0A645FCW2_9ZZZZ
MLTAAVEFVTVVGICASGSRCSQPMNKGAVTTKVTARAKSDMLRIGADYRREFGDAMRIGLRGRASDGIR